MNTYLFAVQDSEDIERLDRAIEKGNLGCDKIGKRTYLGYFSGDVASSHQLLKSEAGIVGGVRWNHLGYAELTI